MKYITLMTLLVLTQHAHAISMSTGLNFANIGFTPAPAGAWTFVNTPDEAILSGKQFFTGTTSLHGDLDFRLNEPVRYSIQSLSLAVLNQGGSFFTEILLTDSLFRPGTGRPPAYRESDTVFAPLGVLYLADTGTLDPGRYTFHYALGLKDGIVASGFNFTMSRVPDAGSSLLLMSLGLGAIGIWRRAIRV